MPLSVLDQSKVAAADRSHILGALATVRSLPPGRWLSAGHPHSDGQLPRDDVAFNALQPGHIIESVAIRGPLHCTDGWSFLARALSALLSGDGHVARHLAYYAELRAALSILASQGIGVFNSRNVVVDVNGNVLRLANQGTHQMCWEALAAWAALPQSLNALASAVSLNSVPLLDTVRAFFASPASSSLAAQLIHEWGFDLSNGPDDRNERNLSSYNPNDLTPMSTLPGDDFDFVQDLWAAFEPSRWYLEKHMLRKMLDLEQNLHGALPLADQETRFAMVDPRVSSQVSLEFLFRHVPQPQSIIMDRSAVQTRPAPAPAMMARAALLLRVATSMADRNLVDAGVSPLNHLGPWWRSIGVERGLWAPNAEPASMIDLWYDIEVALDLVQTPIAGHRYGWLTSMTHHTHRLYQTERIALWNLCT